MATELSTQPVGKQAARQSPKHQRHGEHGLGVEGLGPRPALPLAEPSSSNYAAGTWAPSHSENLKICELR